MTHCKQHQDNDLTLIFISQYKTNMYNLKINDSTCSTLSIPGGYHSYPPPPGSYYSYPRAIQPAPP